MAISLVDITWPDGKSNTAGIKQYIYIAPISEFLVIPKVAATPAALADLVTITANYTFVTGKCWHKVYCTLENGEIKTQQVGKRDGRCFENTADGFLPGSEAISLGYFAYMANTGFIALIPERNGKVRVIGNQDFPATMEKADGTSGKAPADSRGQKFEIKASEDFPAAVYTGTITLTPAT